MRIYEITNRTPECLAELLAVWERSVRATHTFLSESEILRIRGYVPQALAAVPQLAVLAEDGRLLGFLGAGEGRLEMLFLAPSERGQGTGRQLLQYGVQTYGIRTVTVNEQNQRALDFYRRRSYKVHHRTPTDQQGRPYPLLYLTLSCY